MSSNIEKMIYNFEKDYKGIKLLPIAISKVIGTLFGVAVILNFTAGFIIILKPSAIPFIIIFLFVLPIYVFWKNDPQGWSNTVTIDFQSEEILRNGKRLKFNSIKKIEAMQFESFIFPTYYKISLVTKKENSIKLIAIKSPQEYSDILTAFSSCNIKIN